MTSLFLRRLPALLRGWAEGGVHVFCLALAFYLLTVGPSVSLWDSGEFVCCAAGLDVGHPPGAPLYWLVLRLAVILAPAGCEALACSVASALCCAAAAAVLSLVAREAALWAFPRASWRALFVAQSAAGLSWAFADSVWAVAVETEVYGAACLLAFAVLWLALRFRRLGGVRLLLVACLLVGLASGVHWLAWLLLPVAVAVALSRRGRWMMVVGAAVGCAAVALLVWLASGHVFDFALLADLAAVNILGLPVGVGWAAGALALPLLLLWLAAAWRSSWLGSAALCLFLVSVGFLSYALPLVRGGVAAVSVGSPSDAQRLSDYMSRRQYGSRPLLSGPTYASRPDGFTYEERMDYADSLHRYVASRRPADYSYPSSQKSPFPRMTVRSDEALWSYQAWAQPEGWPDSIPSLSDNLRFFLSYQVGHMMLRYVMWNFCGRQNADIGDGGFLSGNFICGIRPLDDARLHLVDYDSPADGCYALFAVPLILVLAGCVFLARRAPARVSCALLLWGVLTGPALALYINMPPYEPRERDYVFLLLYAVLCLCLSAALTALFHWCDGRIMRARPTTAIRVRRIMTLGFAFAVPALMACQGFAPHNRSGNTLVDSLAKSVLDLCPADAVVVVGGDNDTYPLWYAQQVLGYRRDVRVVNYGLLAADWYAARLLRPDRGAAPLSVRHAPLAASGRLQQTIVVPSDADTVTLSCVRHAAETELGESLLLPSPCVRIPLAGTSVVARIGKTDLDPAELLLLEIFAENPSRPLCLMPDVVPVDDLGLAPYVRDLGPLAYLSPDTAFLSPRRRWQLLTSAVRLPDASAFSPSPDEVAQLDRLHLRRLCADVADDAIRAGDLRTAGQVLRRALSWQPVDVGSPDVLSVRIARLLYSSGDVSLARSVLTSLASRQTLALRRAQALSPSAPATANAIVNSLSPIVLETVDALHATGNDDVAVAFANFIKSLSVAGETL
ncbi:MAG: protein O-mannosyl-transferase family [Marinilabiliaceae bacterium]